MTKVGKSDWEGTFAGTHGNDEDAPIAAIRPNAIERTGARFDPIQGSSAPDQLGQRDVLYDPQTAGSTRHPEHACC